MPPKRKQPPRNAYYFFMMEFREQQKKKGINYGGMNEVAVAADPLWKDMSAEEKKVYEEISKKEKQRMNTPENKFTSLGIPFSEIERQEKEAQEIESAERLDVKNIVENSRIRHQDLYLMDVNWYCKAGARYLIGEFTVLRFNLEGGIIDYYHKIVNPENIPPGFVSDIKYGAEELGLDMPGLLPDEDNNQDSSYFGVLAAIVDYLKKKKDGAPILHPVFTMPDRVAAVQSYLQELCVTAGEDIDIFRVYKLEFLFFKLINFLRTRDDEGFPQESLALAQLKKDKFELTAGIGCEFHEDKIKGDKCTLSRAKRWAFTIMDHCCPVASIAAVPGKHLPHKYDLEKITICVEQKKTEIAKIHAKNRGYESGAPSCNSSVLEDSFCNTSVVSSSAVSSQNAWGQKKTAAPRAPQKDFLDEFSSGDNSEVYKDAHFPVLAAPTRGRGRGRLVDDFSKMKVGK